MEKVTVDLHSPSFYMEPDNKLYYFKRKLTTKTILTKIRKAVKGKNRFSLLEIGTGSGFFLSFLEKEFPNATLVGIEYDYRLIELSHNKIKKAAIVQGNAEGFDLKEKNFDIIVSFQVIEHLYNPELMLNSIRNHLSDNGIFIFTTPNTASIGAKIMKKKWHAFRDDHVSLKSYVEWKSFLEKNGFVAEYCGSTFFSGIPILNRLPLGIINWSLLYLIGSLKWAKGESFIGIFHKS
jgi:SAM-dependent methyltransferase